MIKGACLCGAVQWRFEAVPGGATACHCTATFDDLPRNGKCARDCRF